MSFMRFRYPIRQISAPPKIRHNKTFHLQTDILTLCPKKKEKAGSGNSFLQSGIAVGIETAHPPCPEVKERQAVWKDERMYMSWFRKGWT